MRQMTTLETLDYHINAGRQAVVELQKNLMRVTAVRAVERNMGKSEDQFGPAEKMLVDAQLRRMEPPKTEPGRRFRTMRFADPGEDE